MKALRIILSLLLISVLLFSLVSCRSQVDKVERKLTKEGFTITRYGEGAPTPSLEISVADGVVTELRASRVSEWLVVKEFEDPEVAAAYSRAWEDAYELAPNMISKCEDTVVYYGMRSVYELIK